MEIIKSHKRYHFYLENGDFIIMKRTWLGVKEIKRIDASTIKKMKCINPYEDVGPLSIIFYYIISCITLEYIFDTDNVWKKHLIIHYSVNNDEAIYSLDIKLKGKDISTLKKALIKKE